LPLVDYELDEMQNYTMKNKPPRNTIHDNWIYCERLDYLLATSSQLDGWPQARREIFRTENDLLNLLQTTNHALKYDWQVCSWSTLDAEMHIYSHVPCATAPSRIILL